MTVGRATLRTWSVLAMTLAVYAISPDVWPAADSVSPTRPWFDTTRSIDERARLAVQAMTLEEKLSLLKGDTLLDENGTGVNACVGHLPGVTRLGIPALCFGDGPAGVGNGMTQVTQFPAPIAAAAAWDVDLAKRYGIALGEEHAGKGRNVVLAPTINILRTPKWGRAAESFGEDSFLTSRLAVAVIDGIQSKHIIATPKHFVANNQETLRLGDAPSYSAIDVRVSERALREIYYPAFHASVSDGHAGAIMCSYNRVNGAYACENPALDRVLRHEWRFTGFVVSDWYFAHRSTLASVLAGLDVSMPGGSDFGFPEFYGPPLRDALNRNQISIGRIDTMVANVIRPILQLALDQALLGNASANVRTTAHLALASQIAEEGSVLLKNRRHLLPLTADVRRIAVIGDDAGAHVQTTERYGGFVNDPQMQLRTPLAALTERAGDSRLVRYAPGTLGTAPLPLVPAAVLTNARGSGLVASWYGSADWSGSAILESQDPNVDLQQVPPTLPKVWSVRWQGSLTPPTAGRYRFSLSGGGDAELFVDGRAVVRISKQGFTTVSHGVVALRNGRPVPVRIDYSMAPTISKPTLQWGWQPPDDLMQRAVNAARDADCAIVFASDNVSEGGDRSNLSLPGDQDALIAAVAAVNPRTIVVLHTVGPVLMPWLSKAAAVIEAWYPGEQAADAIAAVLFGDVNPSGKLPMTFPAGETQGPGAQNSNFPGINGVVYYDEGIRVGYRYYDSFKQTPLFPFGFGMSYTNFRIDDLQVAPGTDQSMQVRGNVTNAGNRPGAAVVQLYVGFPDSAGEAPWQLKGFRRIELAAGEKREFRVALDPETLAVWNSESSRWITPPGEYHVKVGLSSRDDQQHASFVR